MELYVHMVQCIISIMYAKPFNNIRVFTLCIVPTLSEVCVKFYK